MKRISLYIHIPFCIKKCFYCDFVSFTASDGEISRYVGGVIEELRLKADFFRNYEIKTIFVGGGTPSRLPVGELTRIIDAVKSRYNLNVEEFSIEVNPVSFDIHHIKEYKALGVNRISLGVQSLDDRVLAAAGRVNNSKETLAALGLAAMYFDNVNADIMIGLPQQTVLSLVDTLHELFNKKIKHISCYGLILGESTPLYKMVKYGQTIVPDEDRTVNMYNIATDILEANGYKRYEISNFAKSGYECAHNKVYWYRDNYIGIGVAAHSLVMDTRSANVESVDTYLNMLSMGKLPVFEETKLSLPDKKTEAIMLALRCADGLDINAFDEEFGTSFLKEYADRLSKVENYTVIEDNRLKIKPQNFYTSNYIIGELI